ncbi:MAG: hypothetical protein HY557_06845 [Euryarchaeota archaeon]|nr:hypothetical protein [Euryarchaeota archaeon]
MTGARRRTREGRRGKKAPSVEMSEAFRRYGDRRAKKQKDLLKAIKRHIPELKEWASDYVESPWGYEDGMYRFYHHSFKVMALRGAAEKAVDLFRRIGPRRLNPDFETIVRRSMTDDAKASDVVMAFLHTKYFVEVMIRYGTELEEPPSVLPSGWASVLYLYNMR